MENLSQLFLENNELRSLPPEIGNLESLVWLHIGRNYLTVLPKEIGNLKNLISLKVVRSGANLYLPEGICYLKYLENLYVDDSIDIPYCLSVNRNPRFNIIRTSY